MRVKGLAFSWGVLAAALLFIVGCGNSEVDPSVQLFEQPTETQRALQEEIRMVVEEVELYIVEAVASYQGHAGVTGLPIQTDSGRKLLRLGDSPCAPELKLVLVGLSLDFERKDGCRFAGKITLSLFPLVADVDLEVHGLSFVRSIQLRSDIRLSGGSPISLSLNFLDARIHLRLLESLPIENLVLNGTASVSFGSGQFSFEARTNAFESSTGAGFAALFDIQRKPDSQSRTVQGCMLSGGVPMDPLGGTLGTCFTL